ncbi:MAG: ArsR/SmtB family transcription factor [bacterium]
MATVVRAKFDAAEVERAARAFEAVGEETRLKILKLLSQHDALCVCEIQQAFDLGQPTISHHLRVLREAGLVDAMRRGTWAYYSLRKDAVKWLIKDLMAAV